MNNENELAMIMMTSFFCNPYTIHKARPVNNTANIHIEISSAFFFLIILINCGSNDIAVKALAPIPVKVVISILLHLKKRTGISAGILTINLLRVYLSVLRYFIISSLIGPFVFTASNT